METKIMDHLLQHPWLLSHQRYVLPFKVELLQPVRCRMIFRRDLGALLHGQEFLPVPPVLSKPNWTMEELRAAIRKLRSNKTQDERGSVAELLHSAPECVLHYLLSMFNDFWQPVFRFLMAQGNLQHVG